jgi:hypothetical protein
MNNHRIAACALWSALALLAVKPAAALTLDTQVLSIYQVGTTGQVKLGHVVHAFTNYNRLIAGGGYMATCFGLLPTTGSRTLSTGNLVGGLRLTVTIPAHQPAYVSMPGFSGQPRGSEFTCTYNWTSNATEGGYSVGAGGISYQTGNGHQAEGGTEIFRMRVPSGTDPNENSTCIP